MCHVATWRAAFNYQFFIVIYIFLFSISATLSAICRVPSLLIGVRFYFKSVSGDVPLHPVGRGVCLRITLTQRVAIYNHGNLFNINSYPGFNFMHPSSFILTMLFWN